MTDRRRTRRWHGAVGAALLAGGLGMLSKEPLVVLSAVVGVAFAAYPGVDRTPSPDLEIGRTVNDPTPDPGDPVEVTVTVWNAGERTLPDVRLVDGVPAMLQVVDGTPRQTAVLPPGDGTTFSYTVRVRRGVHRFEPATAIVRNLSGSIEVETTVTTDTEIDCGARNCEILLRQPSGRLSGQLETGEAGPGVEFHGIREYRHGDSMDRIDWNRMARTGELATVEFRERKAAAIVLCLDARQQAYRASGSEPHALGHSVAAVRELLPTFSRTRTPVGIAAIGRDLSWFPPGTGHSHRSRARDFLASNPTLSSYQPTVFEGAADASVDGQVTELQKRLGPGTQVVLLSPLLDKESVEIAIELETNGYTVTVVSPDVVDPVTVGGRVARVERANRLSTLRESDVRALDWDPEEPLGVAIFRARQRWPT